MDADDHAEVTERATARATRTTIGRGSERNTRRKPRCGLPLAQPGAGHLWVTVKWASLTEFGEPERWECVGLGIDFAPGARVRPLQRRDLDLIKMSDLLGTRPLSFRKR